MASLPTVILVHGAWHIPANYQGYADALRAKGFKVHCPHLPSCNGSSPPTAFLSDDTSCIRKVIQSAVDAGERVLMIMHSYGGAPGTGAVEGLSLAERKTTGQHGGVIHLLYMCAYILRPGTTIWEIVQETGYDKLWDQYVDIAADGTMAMKDEALAFFSGNAEQAAVDRAIKTLVRFPFAILHEKTTGSAWKTIPTTYVSTTKDYALLKPLQDLMLAKVWEDGIKVKVEEYDADHSLFITREGAMVEAALRAATDERNVT
ncbi:hypothetical protein VI817_009525 [Penicillium citrinum]|uniref:AB hydrolase-1 domain-containing protein n=1 Tax=Penicillium hetheringtonii TaxID=911720 RepID=A0AAD6GRP2_9EURO|nr:hypothetical protein N7450_007127 [Penicillium hetheringtonii]KAK5788567.1 hypothetical protein VI817_009525 [Penicillium citrinum]